MSEKTVSVQLVLASHCNGYAKPRLFGGQLMAWIDIIGAVAAQRYTQTSVTTVCVDHLNFLRPAFLGDTIVQEAYVTWTGRTSLEVCVNTYVERLSGEREMTNQAYLVFVALNEHDVPVPVKPLIPETVEEKLEYARAEERRKLRMSRKNNASDGRS
ncbi:MAG: acyl-CoA thioesterase [Clostridia bacterium]|nr:acyl-CoA thioesterase [Clostridia bacterium]